MMAPIGSIESFTPGGGATAAQASAEFGCADAVLGLQPGAGGRRKAADKLPDLPALRPRRRRLRDDHVRRAVANGYTGFCLTVDTASYSRRERDSPGDS